jgi:hypothetical protein
VVLLQLRGQVPLLLLALERLHLALDVAQHRLQLPRAAARALLDAAPQRIRARLQACRAWRVTAAHTHCEQHEHSHALHGVVTRASSPTRHTHRAAPR